MSILNLFSLEHNYAQRRKPVLCLALSPHRAIYLMSKIAAK